MLLREILRREGTKNDTTFLPLITLEKRMKSLFTVVVSLLEMNLIFLLYLLQSVVF